MKGTFQASLITPNLGMDELNLMISPDELRQRLIAAGGFGQGYGVELLGGLEPEHCHVHASLPSGGHLEFSLLSGTTRALDFRGFLRGHLTEPSACIRFMAVMASAYQVNNTNKPPLLDLWPSDFHDLPDKELAVVIRQLGARFDAADPSRAGMLVTVPDLIDLKEELVDETKSLAGMLDDMCRGW